MGRIEIVGETIGDRISWEGNRKGLKERIIQLFPDRKFRLTIEEEKDRRTPEQNRFLWGVVYREITFYFRDWAPDQRWTTEDIHRVCKDRFLPVVFQGEMQTVYTPTGERIEQPYSTTKLSIQEFIDYVDLIYVWAEEMDMNLSHRPDSWDFGRRKVVDIDLAA